MNDGVRERMLEKMLMRFGQKPSLNGMRQKYVKEKLAAEATISLKQEKASAWCSEKHPKNTPHDFTSLKLDTEQSEII